MCSSDLVAYLNIDVREGVEALIEEAYELHHTFEFPTLQTWQTDLSALEVKPPAVVCYFVTPKSTKVAEFIETQLSVVIDAADMAAVEEEYVFHTTHALNVEFYASDGRTDAFVLSHGRDILILKLVGYAEDVIRY